jgi:hypothetical protein
MTTDASGFGLKARIVASETFPAGFDVTQFADDTDPFDIPTMQIRDKGMGLNGDLVVWSKASPSVASLSLVPGSDDDVNMAVLFEANRVGRGKVGARDIITLTVFYPNGDSWTGTEGVITDGMPGRGVASAGRLKTNTYQFAFENINRA